MTDESNVYTRDEANVACSSNTNFHSDKSSVTVAIQIAYPYFVNWP